MSIDRRGAWLTVTLAVLAAGLFTLSLATGPAHFSPRTLAAALVSDQGAGSQREHWKLLHMSQASSMGRGMSRTIEEVTFGGGTKAEGGTSNRMRASVRHAARTERRP